MVKVSFGERFRYVFFKIKDDLQKTKIIKQLEKLKLNPEVGNPMKNVRKGTRELYIGPHRLSYIYLKDNDEVVILDFYHKDKQ